jgi:hypothetical protein
MSLQPCDTVLDVPDNQTQPIGNLHLISKEGGSLLGEVWSGSVNIDQYASKCRGDWFPIALN